MANQMAADGKQLETLVALAERMLLPEGFSVKPNRKVFDDEGRQIAEFDLEIRGNVGSTEFVWLIECRDRPGTGPAPGSWVEQLYGRRTRFGFNKVTAVSTTGFAAGAIEFAKDVGIELREVRSLSPEELSDWLVLQFVHRQERRTELTSSMMHIDEDVEEELHVAFLSLLQTVTAETRFLESTQTGSTSTVLDAFANAVTGIRQLDEQCVPNGSAIPIRIHANYTDGDHYVVETAKGKVRIRSIEFEGSLRVIQTLVPITSTTEYKKMESGDVVSQVVAFDIPLDGNANLSLELHRMNETGKTHVFCRRLTK